MKMAQKGFTLVELVIVIVILGIWSATALPKFVDLGTDARAAVVKATEGQCDAANGIVYASGSGQLRARGDGPKRNDCRAECQRPVWLRGKSGGAQAGHGLEQRIDRRRQVVRHTGAKTVGATCGVTYGCRRRLPPTYTTNVTGC